MSREGWMTERVLVCGGRDYADAAFVDATLDAFHGGDVGGPITCIIHGGATGADSLAGAWAARNGVPVEVYPADWQAHGKAAGPIRNAQMVREGRPTLVIAFPGGRGTENMAKLAKQIAEVPVVFPRRSAPPTSEDGAR